MKKIIKIDKNKCYGCGECVTACHEGAIALIDGKAALVREDFCDGLGDCLPVCKAGAIAFEEKSEDISTKTTINICKTTHFCDTGTDTTTQLLQWPCKLRLIPTFAPYLDGSDLLIAADCAAFAHGDFPKTFMRGRITLTLCPKFEAFDYKEKLREIIKSNNIKSITAVRMEVPCCSGGARAVEEILNTTGKEIPYNVVTLTTGGKILK